MTRILVPLDGSQLAESVLSVVEMWAQLDDTEVVLPRAIPPERPVRRAADVPGAELEEKAYLMTVADRLERQGLARVRQVVWYDVPSAAIIDAAATHEVDLIAMATHGRSGLSRLLLGSVAEAVVASAQVPVLLMRGLSAWKPWATRRIVVPLDGSEASERILPVVERLARARDLTVALLQVIESPGPGRSEGSPWLDDLVALRRRDAATYLAKVAERLEQKGVRVESAVKVGDPAVAIAGFARYGQVDLVAMMTHGRTGIGRLVFGSVAAGVLGRASVPVLLSKPGEAAGW
jgi:nucleotide-binding universal stress UspA family protein